LVEKLKICIETVGHLAEIGLKIILNLMNEYQLSNNNCKSIGAKKL